MENIKHSNVGVIFSENTRMRYIEEAKRSGQIYKFSGAAQTLHWLKGEYAYLAPAAVCNLLRRMSIKFDLIREEELRELDIGAYQVLILANCGYLEEATKEHIKKWLNGENNFLVVSGATNLPVELLGIKEIKFYRPLDFSGFRLNGDYYITSARDYCVGLAHAGPGGRELARLFEFRGDLTNPATADKVDLNAPAILSTDKTLYFLQPIFEYIGGLLQGHLNPLPVMNWRSNKHYFIEDLVMVIHNLLEEHLPSRIFGTRLKVWGRHSGVLSIKHDTDSSREPAYYEYELQNRIPATYSVLLDRNAKLWLQRTAKVPLFEASFHYYTNKFGRFTRSPAGHRPSVTRKGLYRQVFIANKFFRIPIATCQRHAANFYYPETIDAMDYLYKRFPQILGLGSMFRYNAYRYGSDDIDGDASFTIALPDISVPFWFPFKLTMSAIERYNILRGWDITSMVEPNIYQVSNIMDSEILEGAVFTLGYHPCAMNRSGRDGGRMWDSFVYAIEKARKKGFWIANCKMVYQKLNDWEDVRFRINDGKAALFNPTDRCVEDMVIKHGDNETDVPLLGPGEVKEVEL